MIAVLTGDIVHSTKMTDTLYQATLDSLRDSFERMQLSSPHAAEIYRGDGFQVQFTNPSDALKHTLLLKLSLHSCTLSSKPILTTLSLAFGEYTKLDVKPNTSSGSVFVSSGRGLEDTARGDLSIHLAESSLLQTSPSESVRIKDNIELLTHFLNHILNRLTQTQARLLYQYIEHDCPEHHVLAELTGTTRQNISNRLSNIGAHLIKEYMASVARGVN